MITASRGCGIVVAATLSLSTVVLPTAASAASASTALSAAQARAAYVTFTDRAVAKGLNGGMRMTGGDVWAATSESGPQTSYAATVVVDSFRRTVSETDDTPGYAYPDAVGGGRAVDTCRSESAGSESLGTRETYLTRAGVARFESIAHSSYPAADKARLLGRKNAKWERISTPHTSLRQAVRGGFALTSVLDGVLRSTRVTGGSVTPTATGSTYVIDYVDLSQDPQHPGPGVVRADVDATGAVTELHQTVTYPSGLPDDPASTLVTTFAFRYGTQKVVAPTASTYVTHKRMISACHALRTRERVPSIADWTVSELNGARADGGPRVTVSRIRAEAAALRPPKVERLNIKVTRISGGVRVTGRHKLLKHAVVWTVVLRHGKAVAHRVR